MTTVAVIGHVEWVELLDTDHVPRKGELLGVRRDRPRAGGGAVIAASVMADHGADVLFIGALGDDPEGDMAVAQLRERGVDTHMVHRHGPTRRAFVLLDSSGERTILTAGERFSPRLDDDLPWNRLKDADGVYLTAGDGDLLSRARDARILVATPRTAFTDGDIAGPFDALIFSAHDQAELALAQRLQGTARLLVGTEGAAGGRWWGAEEGRWSAAPTPGDLADTYGCGDSFAAGFTLALARGAAVADAAALGAAYSADMATRHGAP